MKVHIIASLILSVFLVAFTSPLYAKDADAPEAYSKFEHYYADYKINEDATMESTFDYSITILQKDAVERLKSASVSYKTSTEKADIIEAYTRKADGHRIDAPKDNFWVKAASGKDKNAPDFSDQTTLTVLFPDVAEGDTVHLSYKITQTETDYPNRFSIINTFSKYYTYEDAHVTISVPLSLKANYESFGLTEKTNKLENGRQILEWTYENKNPAKVKYSPEAVYNPEKEPGFLISNFPSYASIAEAYGERVKPKTVVTAKIRKLADEITKGKTTPRDQAKALYTWVWDTLGFDGTDIGANRGAVPRDMDFVIDNKMGSCIDQVTLLQALLAAKGIQSTQALVHADAFTPLFHLPKIPVDLFEHVIAYIPSMNLFLDPTSFMPFGLYAPNLVGKPVLLVDGYKDGFTVPTIPDDWTHNKLNMKMKINEDGSVNGDIRVELRGIHAGEEYYAFKNMHKDGDKEMLDEMLKNLGYDGTLEMTRDEFDDTNFIYGYDLKFTLKQFMKLGSPGAFYIFPLFTESLLARYVVMSHAETVDGETMCFRDHIDEEYTYEFPPNMHVLAVPDNVTASTPGPTYKSTYRQDGQILKVSRTLDDETPGPTCMPEVAKADRDFSDKALPDLKAQIVYK